jgi:hypothetical protein
VGASERNEWLRVTWKVTVAGVLDPRRLVFVDECGTHVSLAPIYGYSPKGERVRLKVPRNRGKNTTLLASMSTEGMGPCLDVCCEVQTQRSLMWPWGRFSSRLT